MISSSSLLVLFMWTLPTSSSALWSLVNPFAPRDKTVTFVRHGCTYMNEYLGGADGGQRFGSPNFTDVFVTDEQRRKYHDTPLSPRGLDQVAALHRQRPSFVDACDLVVTSPLTRAIQTFDKGLRSHIQGVDATGRYVPVLAHPDAAERLYLVSDRGRPVDELRIEFPWMDFDLVVQQLWWYQGPAFGPEWRPTGQGQRYACASEPVTVFDERMSRFYAWLEQRPEQHIVVVCHHGVMDWMLDAHFENCQHRTVALHRLRPRFLQRTALSRG